MASLLDCYQFLWSPRLKARLTEHLVHLKLYEARLQELNAGILNLKKARDAVQHKVDEEDNRYGRGIPVKVKEWIEAVIATISEYEKFDEEEEDHKLAVFDLFKSGYLPKTGIRYQRSRKAFDITRRVNGLLQTANHDTFSYWLGPPSMDAFFHTIGYESFPSRDETMKNIKHELKSPNARMIGLHGLSGVGKTTLVKEIGREASQASETAKMFNVVPIINVTRKPDIRKIQGQIADTLGMKLDEESDVARAARIRRRLKNEKESTLIILDELWSALDFNMIGIPLESDDDVEHSRMKTMTETPFEHVKGGKILEERLSRTKTMKETPSESVIEGKILRERLSRTKTMKETPSGYVKEGKTLGEHNIIGPEKHNSAISMIKSRKLPGASSGVKTEETLSHYKGCKVLLISESKQVLLSQMEGMGNSIYFLDVLKEKEAEALFKKMAGISDRNSEFHKLVAQIANKCNGLPMSIVTTARALKNQCRSRWEDAFRKLEWQKLTGAPELSTRLSYDHLEDEELKYTFLICSCMGPDALIMDLVKYCIGLGFLQGIYTVKEARSRIYALVGRLKVSGLLSDSHSSDHFTMSDIVRRAALSIASEEKQHLFTLTKGKVDEWPDEDKLERYAAISLHHCDINDGFPSRINFLKLRIFHVNNNNPRLEIPENIFVGMKELKVLILTGIDLSQFPLSIRCLTKLRMLCLENCKLGEKLSIIGELKKLRILNFSGSDIEKLPVELKYLTKLQIFDISNCSRLTKIPSYVISSLISLEELYMRNTSIQWEVEEQTYESENASLSELRHLNQLTTLDIQIPNASHLPMNLFFDKLYSYKIVIGDLNAYSEMDFKIPEKYEASRFLAIQMKDGFDIHSQMGIKMLFERVEYLFLEDLHGVKDIFYMLNLKGFPYLRHLLVVNNSNIQSLINPKERRHPEKAFPILESLYLYNLNNLDKICSCKLSIPSFGKLKSIKINLCGKLESVFLISVRLLTVLESLKLFNLPDLETIGFERDMILQRIELLILNNCPCLVNIMHSSVSLTHLTKLEVVNCSALVQLIPLSAAKSLVQLNSMKVIKCESMVEVVGNDEENAGKVDIVFRQLKVLELVSLKNLVCFSKRCAFEFPSLEKVVVSACPKMEFFSKEVKTTPLLRKIYVVHEKEQRWCWKDDLKTTIQEIFKEKMFFEGMDKMSLSKQHELQQAWRSDVDLKSSWFFSLKTLKLDNCDIGPYAVPSNVLPYLKSLKELKIWDCNKVKVIFAKNDAKSIPFQLNNLTLAGLSELEHVWEKNCQGNIIFQNLQQVLVRDCKGLKTLFPATLAKNLKNLEQLEIESCQNLLEVVGKEEVGVVDAAEKFIFPCLTSLQLVYLPELTCFYPEVFNVECPDLHELVVLECPKLELFQSFFSKGEGEVSSTSINRHPLFSDLKAISFLEALSIDWEHSSVLRLRLQLTEELKLLKEIRLFFDVHDNEKPTLPVDLLDMAPNLLDLSIEWCKSLKVFHTLNTKISEQLKILTLNRVSELKFIGSEDSSWLNIVWEKLHKLNVLNCPGLTKLFPSPSAVYFSYLKELHISNCHGLEYLFPSSVSMVFMHLEEITVKESQSIKEIVQMEQDKTNLPDVRFERLYCISLDSLSSLECFYSGNDTLQLPSLTQVDIRQCPKMEIFSQGRINAESFRGIQASHNSNDDLVFHNNDLNDSIRRVFLLQMLSEGMDKMSFSKHPEIQEAWHIGLSLTNNLFYSLKTLKLDNCSIEHYAIPSNILPCLKSLKDLTVRNCDKVKVIFCMTDTGITETASQLKYLTLEGLSELTLVWEKKCKGILIFKNLQQVSVCDCNSMQTLFPEALAKNLKNLEKLEIESCDELREIVAKEEDASTDVTKKFVFPRLTSLLLDCLPELTSFYPEIFTMEFPKLKHLLVLECPKLELFQGAHPDFEGESNSTSIKRQHLFSGLKATSILEELSLDWKHISLLKMGQSTEDLKYLNKILLCFDGDEEEATLPLEILEKAHNLQDMTLALINSLQIFLTCNPKVSEHRILGQLKTLTLLSVSEIQCISLEDSWLNTVYEKLVEINVMKCPGLTKLIHSPSVVSFSYLKDLYINRCHRLEYLFSSSVAKVLMHLERIIVKRCQSIKEIVAKEQDETASQRVKFEWLNCIHLDSLSSLECFYSGNDTFQLPSLTQVDIIQCPKMRVFSQGEINAKSFRGIRTSFDSNDELVFDIDLNTSVKRVFLLQMLSDVMDKMSFSKHPEIQEAWHAGLSLQNNLFYSLKTLKLDNCGIEHYAIPPNILPCLKSLKDLTVRNCDKVKVIFCMNDTGITETAPQLKYLTLEGLSELTLVWEKNFKEILRFQNLQQVSVCDCKSIQTLFPADLAKILKKLEKLEIESCNELREIVGKEEDAGTNVTEKFVFAHLTSLHLSWLPELTSFYPEIVSIESPKLKTLYVLGCPKLELFQGAHSDCEGETNSSTSLKRHHLFSGLKAISFLEELSLNWKHISLLKFGQHIEDLKYLNKTLLSFHGNEEPTLPLEILEKAHNLQDMTLGLINSRKMFLTPIPKISEHTILGQLKILTLNNVLELQCIGFEDSWLNPVCAKLDGLNVTSCPDLTKIFHSPSAMSFSYLKDLNIDRCHGLEYLFTSSVAKVLIHLEMIIVKRCQSIKEIVAKEKDGTNLQGIKFEWLNFIQVDSLSSLKCFYPGNDTLQLPSLMLVDISQCPKMEVFSQGEINTISFRGIKTPSNSIDNLVYCNNDLNASVEKVFLLQQDHMIFGDSPLLKAIWIKSKTVPDSYFGNLNSLVMEGCQILSDSILPSHLLPVEREKR